LKLTGNEAGPLYATPGFNLYSGEGVNSPQVFGINIQDKTISWQAGSQTGSFTSITGLDGTYRTAVFEYNPLTGAAKGTLGTETIFNGIIAPGLTVKTVGFKNNTAYWASTAYSIDNVGSADVPEPVTLGLLLTGGVMLLKRRSFK
jgi:hypothetical protein